MEGPRKRKKQRMIADADADGACSRRLRDRNSAGTVEKVATYEVLRPSAYQMRYLWDQDNYFAHKEMGVPLRKCLTIEPPDDPSSTKPKLDDHMMARIVNYIENMWKALKPYLEIYYDKDHPSLGLRLRFKENMHLVPLGFESFQCGWKAAFEDSWPSAHLYYRGQVLQQGQYLGGPVSYSNCGDNNKKSINFYLNQTSFGTEKYLVTMTLTSHVKPGMELLWNYGFRPKKVKKTHENIDENVGENVDKEAKNLKKGHNQTQFEEFNEGSWFLKGKCCWIAPDPPKEVYRCSRIRHMVFRDLCVLCGKPYRREYRNWEKRKCQKKIHFLSCHANFLGTAWDGYGEYNANEFVVDYELAKLNAEILQQLLQTLESHRWKTVPACVLMEDQKNVEAFVEKDKELRRMGLMVLRGFHAPSSIKDLLPIKCTRWEAIFHGNSPSRTSSGKYNLSKSDKQEKQPYITKAVFEMMYGLLTKKSNDEGPGPEDTDADGDAQAQDPQPMSYVIVYEGEKDPYDSS